MGVTVSRDWVVLWMDGRTAHRIRRDGFRPDRDPGNLAEGFLVWGGRVEALDCGSEPLE